MTYTFIGNKEYIKKEIEKISEKFNIENITHYNLTEESVDKAIQDLDTVSLFGDKLVITENIENIDNIEKVCAYARNKQEFFTCRW